MKHHRRLLVCFAGCSQLVTGEYHDDPLTQRISKTTASASTSEHEPNLIEKPPAHLPIQSLKTPPQPAMFEKAEIISFV